jgi:hypothetical protein
MMSNLFEGILHQDHEEGSLGYLLDPYWDELEIQFLLCMEAAMGERKIKWKHTRVNWKEHVEKLIHEEDFDRTYRMSVEAFNTLVDLLRPMITPNLIKALNSCVEPIYPEIAVAVALRWLAGGSYLDLKNVYGISRSTVFRLRDMFLDAVLECSALEIRFPDTPEEIEKVRWQFEAKSTDKVMRGCVGAMDGMLALTKQPSLADSNGNPRAYHSGHYNDYGVNVQAICDARLRFLFFAVAAPGRTGDLVAYELLSIREIIEKLPPGFYIVGDAAYMLTEHVLVPFTGGDRQSPENDTYNFYLSQLRIRIEMAFGLLTNKWRILRKHLETKLKNSSRVLEACARLHNFVIDQDSDDDFVIDEDEWDDLEIETMEGSPLGWGYLPTVEPLHTIPGTSMVRDAIVRHVSRNGYRRPAHNVERRELELHELEPPLM